MVQRWVVVVGLDQLDYLEEMQVKARVVDLQVIGHVFPWFWMFEPVKIASNHEREYLYLEVMVYEELKGFVNELVMMPGWKMKERGEMTVEGKKRYEQCLRPISASIITSNRISMLARKGTCTTSRNACRCSTTRLRSYADIRLADVRERSRGTSIGS